MCCKGTNRWHSCHDHPVQWESSYSHCGCGCTGRDQTVFRLENYKEHLKAELKSVENRIAALRND